MNARRLAAAALLAAAGYTLTLQGSDGATTRGFAFPLDDPGTHAYPDQLFFVGVMYKRQ